MKEFNTEKVWKAGVIALLVLNFLSITALFFQPKRTVLNNNELTVNQKIHLECQRLSVQAGEGWSYKSSVETIKNEDKREASILKVI